MLFSNGEMKEQAIIIEDVWKSYKRGQVRAGDLRTSLTNIWSAFNQKSEEFFALQQINLTINKGDILGIVGPNGAGKSTLLKLLSRITFPTKGRLSINGRLSSMLEVGTGFHPELTGIENIYLNGSILGMRRQEVNAKLDSIIEFSGLKTFLNTPVKHFSSGMYVRLAFAVASHLSTDIILIDEILGVGDQEFRKKCLEKLVSASEEGRTVLIVSHQMSYLRNYCRSGIYIREGKIAYAGKIEDTINHYLSTHTADQHTRIAYRKDRKGDGRCKISAFRVLDHLGEPCFILHAGQEIIIQIELQSTNEFISQIEIAIDWMDQLGHQWFVLNNNISSGTINLWPGREVINCRIPKLPLNEGIYSLDVSVYSQHKLCDAVQFAAQIQVEKGMFYSTAKLPNPSKGILIEYDWKVYAKS